MPKIDLDNSDWVPCKRCNSVGGREECEVVATFDGLEVVRKFIDLCQDCNGTGGRWVRRA